MVQHKPQALKRTLMAAVMLALTPGASLAAPATSDILKIEGTNNIFELDRMRGNALFLTITGDANGGLNQEWPTSPLLLPALSPGQIVQNGFNNSLALEVLGSNILFAVAQSGTDNVVRGFSSGNSNAIAVVQSGHNNLAVFSQNGQGNSLSITQGTW